MLLIWFNLEFGNNSLAILSDKEETNPLYLSHWNSHAGLLLAQPFRQCPKYILLADWRFARQQNWEILKKVAVGWNTCENLLQKLTLQILKFFNLICWPPRFFSFNLALNLINMNYFFDFLEDLLKHERKVQ